MEEEKGRGIPQKNKTARHYMILGMLRTTAQPEKDFLKSRYTSSDRIIMKSRPLNG